MINADEHKWIIEKYKDEDDMLYPLLKDYDIFRCPYCDYNYINLIHIAHNFCPNCGERMVFKKTTEETRNE